MTQFPTVHPALAQGLAAKGYAALTPVQEAVTDPGLAGADLLVSAQTGSGKTVAFGLAMAGQLLADGGIGLLEAPRALIIAPTRELALQVRRELEWLYAPTGAVIAGAVGGMDARSERRALERGAHIVVGTPGRICDHIRRGALDLSALRVAVLDEADEMLDLGFREDLEFILEAAPADRRTLMFSATVSKEIARLAATFQRDAQRISTIASREQHADIEYRALLVDQADRENAIVNVLRFYEAKNAIVFCSTRAMVTHLTTRFLNRGFQVVALSGELTQEERSRALQSMRDGRARVCIATDVAARGIDLPGLELVVHADLPQNKEALLHRSGRTGRAGSKGVSALIVPHAARRKAERLLGFANITATWAPAPSAEEVSARDVQRLLSDPILTAPVSEDEAALAARLLEGFPPRALAAAVVRQYMAARSAPEDLVPVTPDGARPRAAAVDFGPSLWVRLTIGHDQRADPRWLLPMLCRAGDLSRRDIGAIRIFDDHTVVQIHADAGQRFLAAIGPERALEQEIGVDVLDGAPQGLDSAPPRPGKWDRPRDGAPRGQGAKKPFARGPRDDAAPAKKPHRKGPPRSEFESAGLRDPGERPAPRAKYAKPAGKPAGKPGAKPFGKPAGAKGGKPAGGKPKSRG